MTFLAVLALALAIQVVTCQNINSVVTHGGASYALDGFPFLDGPAGFVPRAYKIVNGVHTNTYILSGDTGTLPFSAFVSGATLYRFSGAYGTAYLSKYSLPITTSPAVPTQTLTLASHLMIPAIIDKKDKLAFAVVTRNLNLINLNTLTVTSTFKAIIGSGKTAGALVYDNNANKVYFFLTHYCAWGFCQHIQEYSVIRGGLSQLPESFAPDYNTQFNTGGLSGCALDSTSNQIWCLNDETDKLVKLSLANLNTNSQVALPSADYVFGNVAFDFAADIAYVVSDTVTGFGVYAISIPSGAVLNSATFIGTPVVSVSLDAPQGKLFLGHDNADASPEVTIVNTADLTASTLSL